jgi:hypothetical protein
MGGNNPVPHTAAAAQKKLILSGNFPPSQSNPPRFSFPPNNFPRCMPVSLKIPHIKLTGMIHIVAT